MPETVEISTPLGLLTSSLRSGQLDLAQHLAQVRRRVQMVEPLIHAFLPERGRWTRLAGEARQLAVRWPDSTERPALYGVPVGVKDLFRVDGLPTRAGSTLPPRLFAGAEAWAVRRLRELGALILGKTALDEFAYSEPAPTRNPHNLAHTPGGSSSGSAAAVAAGVCPLALGTQTSRSVIGPAAFCGIVGYKPSHGRVPIDGVVALAPSFDVVGLLTQDVPGMQLAAAALVPEWHAVDLPRPPVLGVPEGLLLSWTQEEGRTAFERHVGWLAAAGYRIVRVPLGSDDEITTMDRYSTTLLHGEMARIHADWYPRYADRYRPRTRRGVERGLAISDSALAAARAFRLQFRAHLENLMRRAGIDLWITPSSAGPAPEGLDITGWGGMTGAWSFAGLPCLSVPAGRAANGLPLGLQLVAGFGQDEALLGWAAGVATALTSGAGAEQLAGAL
jgi:Asp-tRNA(Asn)/Glu-tRNA(Gln) amidotransferase A subunit family amidase